MSTRSVILWLTAAVILGVAAIFLLRTPAPPAPPTAGQTQTVSPGVRLAEFLPGDVKRITITTPKARRVQIIEKAPDGKGPLGADAEWLLRTEAPAGATADSDAFTPAPWPLDPGRVQSLLRALNEARAAGEPAKDATIGDAPTKVVMDLGSGSITWLFAGRAIAGLGLVEVTGLDQVTRRALADDKLLRVFTDPGPAGWRITTPAAGIAPDATRVHLEGGRSVTSIARVAGQWNLTEPVGAPADPGAVQKLQSALAAIRIADFLDDGPAGAPTGLERPRARVRIEADRRTLPPGAAEPVTTTDALDLAVGGAADASGRRLFCSVSEQRVVLLEGSTLADVPTDPTRYLWPAPLRAASGDVGTIALDRLTPAGEAATGVASARTFRRSAGRWVQLRTGATGPDAEAPLGDKEQRDVDALVAFLTGAEKTAFPGSPGAPAASPDARPEFALSSPDGFTPAARVTVSTTAGAPLGVVQLWSPKPGVLTVRSPAAGGGTSADAAVYRTYPATRVPEMLLDVVGYAPDTPGVPATPDAIK